MRLFRLPPIVKHMMTSANHFLFKRLHSLCFFSLLAFWLRSDCMVFIMSRRQVVDLVWVSVATFIALSLFGNAPDYVDALYRSDRSKDLHASVQRERCGRRMTKAQKNMFIDRPSSSPTTTASTMNENANRLWEAEYPKLYNEVACDCAVAFASDNGDCDLSANGGVYSCRNRVMPRN